MTAPHSDRILSRGYAPPRSGSAGDRQNNNAVVAQQTPASPNADEATVQTIAQMAQYVRESLSDELIHRAAKFAVERFGCGTKSNIGKAWAVFWWIKHCVTFKSDEDSLLCLGRIGEQDLLIAPSVLLRFKKPAEDCDGFSMLAAAMLSALNVPVALVAIAADPREKWRYSHVFTVAQTEQGLQAIDASHGKYPGWMVPRSRIYRWQAFDLAGKPLTFGPEAVGEFRGFAGYVSRWRGLNGLGEDDYFADPGAGADTGSSVSLSPSVFGGAGDTGSSVSVGFPFQTGPGTLAPGSNGGGNSIGGSLASSVPSLSPSSSSSAPSSNWLSSLLSNSFGFATKVLAPSTQTTVVRNPLTGQIVSYSSSSNMGGGAAGSAGSIFPTSLTSSAGGSSSMLLLLVVGVGALFLLSSSSKK